MPVSQNVPVDEVCIEKLVISYNYEILQQFIASFA